MKGELSLPPLPDYLAPGLKVVFVGFNPGETSARRGHYYAYSGNRFWWLLWQSGLTDRLVAPTEDATLPERYGYGLTDLVDRPSKSSGDLEVHELRQGREALLAKLQAFRPAVACYNGLGIYRTLTGRKEISYGLQPTQVVEGVLDFVAASPSGRSREPLERKLGLFRELCGIVKR
ncbi:MAG TPA: mismatch-specific DNA-glycosylase [Symbiobacteriaceae bacterium]|nr:mismatch-specific DNA-glycosylase [Symbiobacteriaceae bacterium]